MKQFGRYIVITDEEAGVPTERQCGLWIITDLYGTILQTYYSERMANLDAKARAQLDDEEAEKILLS